MTEGFTFGAELRRLRQAAGLSLSDLAVRVHYSKSYLSKVENGAAPPNEALAALCEAEFAGGTLTALLPPPERRRRGHRDAGRPAMAGLPAVTAHFTGRGTEVDEVYRIMSREVSGGAAVCAVHGMAGVGKTALAVRCAHRLATRFPDGCLFVDLRGHTPDASEVPPGVALDRLLRMLGVPGDEIPADVDDRAARYRDRLAGLRVLVVLDNARTARQVLPLIPAEPKCRVLVTSRHRLAALDDAYHVGLDVLAPEHAAELFRAVVTGAEPDQPPAIENVVRRCGYLPLAIRIAAARLRAQPGWRVADLDRRLGDEAERLTELDDGERSVAAAFQLSYRDMSPAQRRLFGLLALHPGTELGLHAAAALAGDALVPTERLLADLHEAHLLVQQPGGRYQLHDLLRTFARNTALATVPPDEQRTAMHRLLDLSVQSTDQVDRLLAPQRHRPAWTFERLPADVPAYDRETGLAWLRVEWPNLVALCESADVLDFPEHCWRLAFALRGFFFLTKLWDAWITTHEHALRAAERTGDRWAQATIANSLGLARTEQGDLDGASRLYRRALELYREVGDEFGMHTARNNLAWPAYYRGEHLAALSDMTAAAAFYRHNSLDRNAAITLRGVSLVEAALGRYRDALRDNTAALELMLRLGMDLDAAMAFNCRGWIHYLAGDFDAATDAYGEALRHSQRCGSTFEAARAETGLGNVAAALGRRAEAARHWDQATERHPDLDPAVVDEARGRTGQLVDNSGTAPRRPASSG